MSDIKALAIVPRTLDEVNTLADVLAKSSLLPDSLRGKVPDVVVSILAGQELGLSPMAAIRGVHVVQGKPILSADTMVGLVLGSGVAEYFTCVEDTDARVTYETKRRGSPHAQRSSWTVEDTKRAGLNTKDNWRLYPRQMMKARAKAILARDVFPDVLAGCYDEHEIAVPAQARSAPAPVQPPEDVIDAEIVESVDWLAKLDAETTEIGLKALAGEIAKAGLAETERRAVNDRYKERLAAVRKESAA